MTLVKVALQHAVTAAEDGQDRANINRQVGHRQISLIRVKDRKRQIYLSIVQVVDLSDLILDGYSGQLGSLAHSRDR